MTKQTITVDVPNGYRLTERHKIELYPFNEFAVINVAVERVVRKPYRWPKCLRPEIVAIAYDQSFGGCWWGHEGEPHAGESSWDCPNSDNVHDLSAIDPSLLPQIDPVDWKHSLYLKSECEVEQ